MTPGPAGWPGPGRIAARPFIVYRRLTMNAVEPLDRSAAEEYATWFGALADGMRVQVVPLLARSGEPMSVSVQEVRTLIVISTAS